VYVRRAASRWSWRKKSRNAKTQETQSAPFPDQVKSDAALSSQTGMSAPTVGISELFAFSSLWHTFHYISR
jgi:hypothetical protein